MAKAPPQYYEHSSGVMKKWRKHDDERPKNAECYDCGRNYQHSGDCVVPDNIWEQINPTFHQGAGILCANCITERLHVLDIYGVNCIIW